MTRYVSRAQTDSAVALAEAAAHVIEELGKLSRHLTVNYSKPEDGYRLAVSEFVLMGANLSSGFSPLGQWLNDQEGIGNWSIDERSIKLWGEGLDRSNFGIEIPFDLFDPAIYHAHEMWDNDELFHPPLQVVR